MAFVALGRATLAVASALPVVASVDLNTIRAENLDFTLLELERNVPGCYLGLEEAVNGTLDSGSLPGGQISPPAMISPTSPQTRN